MRAFSTIKATSPLRCTAPFCSNSKSCEEYQIKLAKPVRKDAGAEVVFADWEFARHCRVRGRQGHDDANSCQISIVSRYPFVRTNCRMAPIFLP